MAEGLKKMEVGNIQLHVPEGVWPPYVTGKQLAKAVMPRYSKLIRNGVVIDVGTGSGLLAVQAGKLGARAVLATDLNPHAVEAVIHNWRLNQLRPDYLTAQLADGLNDLPGQFMGKTNLLISNPPVQPFLKAETKYTRDGNSAADWNETDANGRAVLDSILTYGPTYLKAGGKLVTSTTTRHGWQTTQALLEAQKARKKIRDWKIIVEEDHELAEFYDIYVPVWINLQKQDGDTRIWRKGNQWSHTFIVLELTK